MVVEPDLGTAIVVCLSGRRAAGRRRGEDAPPRAARVRGLGAVVLLAILIEPYRMQRLTGFLNPTGDPSGAGFQAIQAKIALGSGGIFGVGLGESLQKAFYLPEAHTDMIAAVIGEELGLVGIGALVGLFGLFGYAGLRTAQRARDRYAQAARRRAHVAGPGPGDRQPVRRPRARAADRRAAAVRLLRQLEPARDARRRGLLLNIARGGTRRGSGADAASGAARLRVVDGGGRLARERPHRRRKERHQQCQES